MSQFLHNNDDNNDAKAIAIPQVFTRNIRAKKADYLIKRTYSNLAVSGSCSNSSLTGDLGMSFKYLSTICSTVLLLISSFNAFTEQSCINRLPHMPIFGTLHPAAKKNMVSKY